METVTIIAAAGSQIAAFATSREFIAGGLLGLCLGFLAGSFSKRGQRGNFKKRPTTPGVVEIYVGNLSYDTTDDRLRAEFEKYGKVLSARIISNRFNRKSKGFGFVEMPVRAEAEAAIKAIHDMELQGRKLRVNEARNKA